MKAVAWRVFFTCWLVYTVFWTPFIIREHFPAITIAEAGTLNVEQYLGWIDDIFEGPKGGAFINNNPGASLTGALPLVALRPILNRIDLWNQARPRGVLRRDEGDLLARTVADGREFYFLSVAFLTVALVMAPVTAATAAYLYSRMSAFGVPMSSAALLSVLYALGTPVFYRTGQLNHNLLVGDAGILALLLLWDPRSEPLRAGRAAQSGLMAGYAVLCDYSGIIVVGVTAIYALVRASDGRRQFNWKVLAAYAAGVFPGVLALAVYQTWAFGSFYLPSQQFMTPTAPTVHGYRGFDWPSWSLLWANFFDWRFGLFSYCPALILAFAAPFLTRLRYRLAMREIWILLGYFVAFVVFCAANRYSSLQPLTGFRYLVPVVPALSILAMQVSQVLPKVLRWLIAAGALIHSFSMAFARENNAGLNLGIIIHRNFQLTWMRRLENVGVPVTSLWPVVTFGLLIVALAAIWTLGNGETAIARTRET